MKANYKIYQKSNLKHFHKGYKIIKSKPTGCNEDNPSEVHHSAPKRWKVCYDFQFSHNTTLKNMNKQ